jgi:hypothetical protein
VSAFTDSTDVISVVTVADIRTNSACVSSKKYQDNLAELQSAIKKSQTRTA